MINIEPKESPLLICSVDEGSVMGKIFYIDRRSEVSEVAEYVLNRGNVQINKSGTIKIQENPTENEYTFSFYEYDMNSGSYSRTNEGRSIKNSDNLTESGDSDFSCEINGSECDYITYKTELDMYQSETGLEDVDLSEASTGIDVIDMIKNY